jgi:hypothetical protein
MERRSKATEEQLSELGLIPEIVVKAERKEGAPGGEALGGVSYWRATAGNSGGDKILKITGLGLATATPWLVVFQSRQNPNLDNLDRGWPDQFAIQVIETSNDFIRVRIRRIDNPAHGSGWAQQLTLNFIVRE